MSEQKKSHVNRWQIGAFVLPAIPISALGLPVSVYLPPFYEQLTGLGVGAVGLIFMFARFWDVFTDPVLGLVSDRFTTRWGRRRHWIVLSVPIIMVGAYMLFMPPESVSVLYLLFWMFFMYIGYTLISIGHISWGAELSPDYHERTRIQGWREFALVFGMFTVLAMPAVMELIENVPSPAPVEFSDGAPESLPGTSNADIAASAEETPATAEERRSRTMREKVETMGWFIIVLLPITVGIAVLNVGERPVPDHEPIHWKETFRIIQENKSLRRLLIADLLAGYAPGVSGALYIFFIAFFVGLPGWASMILLLYFIAAFAGVPFWIQLSYKVGKHRAFSMALLYGAIVISTYYFAPFAPFWLVLATTIAYGLAYGASPFLLRSMMADVRDYDLLHTGQERTGLYFSLLTMTSKIGGALAVGTTYLVLGYLGFSSGLGFDNSEAAIFGLGSMFIILPFVTMVFLAWFMWNFPLNQEEQEAIREEIERRHGGAPSGDHGAMEDFAGVRPPGPPIEDGPNE